MFRKSACEPRGGVAAMRRLIMLITVFAAALLGGAAAAVPAQAKVPGPNGQIIFGRFSTDLGDFQIFTANPDGTSQIQLLPRVAECPRWSPNGTRILVCAAKPGGLLRPATVRPDGSGFTLLDNPDPTLNLACWAWSPSGARLGCEGWDDVNPGLAGVFTVRSSDGGGLVRVTANPYGAHDIPGDYSPGGSTIVFLRNNDPSTETGALFVVNTNGSGLRRITAWNFAEDPGSWSPDGKSILFSDSRGRCSWSIRTAPGSGRSGSAQAPATTPPISPHGRPTAPASCSACSSPAPASNTSTPCGRQVRT